MTAAEGLWIVAGGYLLLGAMLEVRFLAEQRAIPRWRWLPWLLFAAALFWPYLVWSNRCPARPGDGHDWVPAGWADFRCTRCGRWR